MHRSATRSLAVPPAAAVVIAVISIVGGTVFALDTYQRGWSVGAIAATTVALLAAACAGIGRAARRPSLERATRIIALSSVVIGLATAVYHAII